MKGTLHSIKLRQAEQQAEYRILHFYFYLEKH